MRLIENAALATMTSPVRHVMAYIHVALVNIAPEKREAFDRDFADFTIEYLDDWHWVCNVNVDTRHIRLSRGVVEFIWASALMYFRLQQSAQGTSGGTDVDLKTHPILGPSAALLLWVYKRDSEQPWPTGLPAPVPNPTHASDLQVADELCLGAIALILYHELAHIRFLHRGQSEVDSERDADYFATDWIMGSVDANSLEFTKRSLCVAVALGVTAAQEIQAREPGGITHPRGFDRLVNSLDRHVHNPNHVAWDTVGLILAFHLQDVGGTVITPKEGFASARDCVDAHVEALSRLRPH